MNNKEISQILPENLIKLTFKNKEPYKVQRTDINFNNKKGEFFRIEVENISESLISNCMGQITYYSNSHSHRDFKKALHWKDKPDNVSFQGIPLNPGYSEFLDFLIKYEDEKYPRLFTQEFQELPYSHYFFKITVTSMTIKRVIFFEMVFNESDGSIVINQRDNLPQIKSSFEFQIDSKEKEVKYPFTGNYHTSPEAATKTRAMVYPSSENQNNIYRTVTRTRALNYPKMQYPESNFLALSKNFKTKKEINYKEISIPISGKNKYRVGLVQLDFNLTKQFPHQLKNKNLIEEKIFKVLEIAKDQKVDMICFPELSFDKDFIEKIKKYDDMIIIGGSYYENNYNFCPIIIKGELYSIEKINRSPLLEGEIEFNKGMKTGNEIIIFSTEDKYFRFVILICIDYLQEFEKIYQFEESKSIKFVFIPSYNPQVNLFQKRAETDCIIKNIDIMYVNAKKYGGTCFIGREHKKYIQRLKDEGYREDDSIEYKLFSAFDYEMILIADINLKNIVVPTPPDATPRFKIVGKYICENGEWQKTTIPIENRVAIETIDNDYKRKRRKRIRHQLSKYLTTLEHTRIPSLDSLKNILSLFRHNSDFIFKNNLKPEIKLLIRKLEQKYHLNDYDSDEIPIKILEIFTFFEWNDDKIKKLFENSMLPTLKNFIDSLTGTDLRNQTHLRDRYIFTIKIIHKFSSKLLVKMIKNAINWSNYSIENFSDLIKFDNLNLDQLNDLQDFYVTLDGTELKHNNAKLKLFEKFTERIRIAINDKLLNLN